MTQTLCDRYEILSHLAPEGFGETFLAVDLHSSTQRKVVVKALKSFNHNTTSEIIERLHFKRLFFKEAQVLEELGQNCLQIPTLYDYFCQDEKYYLVQEYIEGKNLTQTGILSPERCFTVLSSLLETLKYIHSKNIIHRDIKPENIIIRDSDELPVLIDFGAIKETMGSFSTSSDSTVSSVVIDTKGFMAPEQSTGETVFSTDLFALGLTMIYSLTGKYPLELTSNNLTGEVEWQGLATNIHPSLTRVLKKAIKIDPSSRYLTAEAMLKDLQTRENFPSTTVSLQKDTATSTPLPPTTVSLQKDTTTSTPLAPTQTITPSSPVRNNQPPVTTPSPISQPIYSPPSINQHEKEKSSNLVIILLCLLIGLSASLFGFLLSQNMNQNQDSLAQADQQTEGNQTQLTENNQQEESNFLTQDEAVNIVDRWYQAKPEIFGRSFNTSLARELSTGELYYNTTKYDGSVNWLRNNGCYYVYDYSTINSVISFDNQISRPSITVQVSEGLALNGSSSSGCNGRYQTYSKPVTYWFEKENGQWKIYNYKVL